MAETRPLIADPVAGLIDIPLPQPVSLLPATWAARIVIVLLAAGIVVAAWHLLRHVRANRYRRVALAELDRLQQTSAAIPGGMAAGLALLVRRTALDAFPRETIAPLAGAHWLAFLDRSYGGDEFSQGAGRLLTTAPYGRTTADAGELRSLQDLVRRWIRGHHV
ncbi:DUF4381 domain-containing protein [Bradyrhizobium tropiciagri]|uniref:DUF4381 domain-containing protein n=1 Tax=Bradyrhizobium tropiciagri TaxID=312253 RepID=UPI001BACE6F3|nr:DUF4381 domain-containing protein [Bradyrhizobium tropiciagri]MBR0896202.1 DUF4381 domain-containing protein [Bradyrhizobium tropiciagri]